MKKILLFSISIMMIVVLSAQQTTEKANYQLASKYSTNRLNKMIFSTSVSPHWLKK